MTKPRIGLFQAGSYDRGFIAAHGTPGDWFKTFLNRASNGRLSYRVYCAFDGELPDNVSACDAYLITGSSETVLDRADWMVKLAQFCIRAMENRPVVGICFGHQLLCQEMGGDVSVAPQGWGVGVHSYQVFSQANWMDPPLPVVSMLTSHMDQVTTLPPGSEVLAGNEFCPYAILRLAPNAITIQSHPEATRACFSSVYNIRRQLYAEGQADQAIASLKQPTHDEEVGRWIVRFIEDRLPKY